MIVNKTEISDYEQILAKDSIDVLNRVSESVSHYGNQSVELMFKESKEKIVLTPKVFELFCALINQIAEGKTISILSMDTEISTQHAANFLKVSRPHVVKLLENKEIPYKKVGSHRRILLADLIAYENSIRQNRELQLGKLVEQAQDLNLGYE